MSKLKETKEPWQADALCDSGQDSEPRQKKKCYKRHYWYNWWNSNMNHGVDYNIVPMLNFLIFIALLSLEKYTLKYLAEKTYAFKLLLNGSGKTKCVCVCVCVCV